MEWEQIAEELGYASESGMWTDLYHTHRKTITQLAKAFGVGTSTIVRRVDKAGVDKRAKGGANNPGRGYQLLLIDARLLWLGGEEEVAKALHLHPTTVYKVRKQLVWRD